MQQDISQHVGVGIDTVRKQFKLIQDFSETNIQSILDFLHKIVTSVNALDVSVNERIAKALEDATT